MTNKIVLFLILITACFSSCGGNNNAPDVDDDDAQVEEVKEFERSNDLLKDLTTIQESKKLKIWVSAHRCNTYKGINLSIPENSLPAIKYAISCGADMIEVDLRSTKDGVIVNMHNPTINTTTNGKETLANITYEELCQYNLRIGNTLTKYKVPRLEEILDEAKDKIYVCMDIKEPALLDKIIEIVSAKGMINQVCYYTGDESIYLDQLLMLNKDCVLFPWAGDVSTVNKLASKYPTLKLVTLSVDNDNLKEVMTAVRNNKLVGYANHTQHDDELINKQYTSLQLFINNKVNVVLTNYPDLAISYLKAKKLR